MQSEMWQCSAVIDKLLVKLISGITETVFSVTDSDVSVGEHPAIVSDFPDQ